MKLADVSIKRAVLASVMNLVLIVVGVMAYPKIGVDLFPTVEFPMMTVLAIYPGADPGAVEQKVIDKLEERLNTLSGLKSMRSTSLENVGQLVLEFELERNADQAAQDVRDKVSALLPELPPDLEPPVVEKFDVGAAPIMSVTVAGDLGTRELTRIADDVIKARLQKIGGVGSIDVVGGREREVHVWLNRERLTAYGLTVSDVGNALRAQNLEVPGGRIQIGGQELTVKTKGEVKSAKQLGDLILTAAGGVPIRVSDIARIEDGQEEAASSSNVDGKGAVSLVIRKQSGANTVSVAEKVKAELENIKPGLPKGVAVGVPIDNSLFIAASIHDVKFDLLFGAILTVLIILFFLHDWRATIISAIALPTSVIATFGFIQAMGFTFNNMTMLGLTLSIGILIDDAIVVIENIHRHLMMGKGPWRAAREATAEIGLAVIAITASILAVFVPVATMKGIIGRFFYQFGLTVAFAVAVSLLVSFTLTPMLSARYLKAEHGEGNAIVRGINRVLGGVERAYRATLAWALNWRWATMGIATLVFFASIAVLGKTPKEFLPPEDRGEFLVKFELPPGASLESTEAFGAAIAAKLETMPGVTTQFTTVGGGTPPMINAGQIHVSLVDRKERTFKTMEAIAYARELIGSQKPNTVSVEPVQAVGGGGMRSQELQFNIRGTDYDLLNTAASRIVEKMRAAGGYVDIDSTYRAGKPELAVHIDRERAADLGIPAAVVASTVRTLIAGEKVTELPLSGDRIDVRVRLEDAQRKGVGDLSSIQVRSASGALVPLSQVVKVERSTGPAQIERQNRLRQVTVLANLNGKVMGDALPEIEGFAKEIVPPELTTDWVGRAQAMQESAGYMGQALLLAIILVYLILAAQFESFIHPLTIMFSLPLATIGAFGALFLTQMSLNIFSMIGVIMLMGLVTKNAVLVVDYANTLRAQGMSKTEALLAAGPVRLRPILMTTAAMVFGMFPVALGRSLGGEQRAPMAVAVIGGLITSTMLTLLVVPVVYSLLDRFNRKRAVEGAEAEAGPTPLADARSGH
jgi:HAE1 family hydrophobic/amphiphilic exporter-1